MFKTETPDKANRHQVPPVQYSSQRQDQNTAPEPKQFDDSPEPFDSVKMDTNEDVL